MLIAEAIFMGTEDEQQSINSHQKAAKKGVDIVLNQDTITSLASFFDVLIQMDLESNNNKGENNGNKDKD
jgi:hypothetical protein